MAPMTETSRFAAPPRMRSRRLRDGMFVAGLLLLFLVGLGGLAAATGWEETLAQLRGLAFAEIALLLLLSLVNYLLRGTRWHIFTRTLGIPTTLVQDLRHFIGGFAMTVTPGRVGELIRMRWLSRETGWSAERTAPLVLVDRAADLATMAILLGAALALSTAGISGALPIAILALLAAYIATHPRLLAWCVTQTYRGLGRWPRVFGRIRQSVRALRHFTRPAVLAPALALGAAGWLAEGLAFHLLLVWMGADIGFWTALGIFVFSTLAGGLTGAPGGMGGAEAAMIALLKLQGIPLEISVPATAVIRLTTLWFAILLGLLVLPLAERTSKRAAIDVENR
ncbi:lysylphosphatidylglycerol synthase transmembrane domain-containing protein [Tropicimonas marinistellae]|uniref:lysylphosphatidylglycerol synthase transmembrane domain-containing protein n=1 Tax=Tropicimonas marinistellae TaxID=1739787 RepID=UPI000A4B3B6F|nr:lysylphosphatidylglycerol synthase transmembrane domain-containing protein [Tropicimonas marinistellae]